MLQWAMQNTPSEIFEQVLAQRDLTNPSDFLVALYFAEGYPTPPPLDEARYYRDLAIVERYHADIFNLSGRAASVTATTSLFAELAKKRLYHGGEFIPYHRREWLAVFRLALAQGKINSIVFGAAVMSAFVTAQGNATPAEVPGSSAAMAVMLNDLRNASPMGLMNRRERECWRNLPEKITLYRGGASISDMPSNRAESVFWTPNHTYARSYLQRREAAGTVSAAVSAVPAMRAALAGFGATGQPGKTRTVDPYIIGVNIPRELVLAYWHVSYSERSQTSIKLEYAVDYEKITPDMIKDWTPWRRHSNTAWAA